MDFKLPVYQFIIDDSQESGVKTISLVDDPAIQSFFVAFDNQKPKQKYFKSEFEQVVFGIALQPDYPIYRIDYETGEEYYGIFTAETIKKIVHKFHKELQSNNVNLMHNNQAYINAYMFSDFIVESDLQIEFLKTKGITDARIGSWVTAYKIEDQEIFNSVLEGNFKGFSVECFLDKVLVDFNKEFKNKFMSNKIKSVMKKINKTLKEKILSIFTELDLFTRTLVPELAFEIEWEEVGAPVNKVIVNPDGSETLQPVGQGEFVTEEGILVVDEASNLVEVRDLPVDPVVETPEVEIELPEAPQVSGDTSISGSTATLAVGDTVVVDEQTGPAASGETVTVTSGSTDMVSGGTKCGIEKSILEIVGTNDGEYTVLVKVEGGVVTSATAQSMVDLMLSKNQEIDALKLSIVKLEEKMKEPITDPILETQSTAVDFSKMTAYEKLMHKKGLQPIK